MSADAIACVSIFGGIWLFGLILWVISMRKTHTKPFELSNKELAIRTFGDNKHDLYDRTGKPYSKSHPCYGTYNPGTVDKCGMCKISNGCFRLMVKRDKKKDE